MARIVASLMLCAVECVK